MVYCENCRFFQCEDGRLEFGKCGNPAATDTPKADRFISATLDQPPGQKYAGLFRDFGACGADATLFEAREPQQVAA